MEHNNSNKAAVSFSTENLLFAFQRAQANFELIEQTSTFDDLCLSPQSEGTVIKLSKARTLKTPIRFGALSKDIREQTRKQTDKNASSALFTPKLLKSEGITMDILLRKDKATLTSNMARFPQFPWAISTNETVIPKKIFDRLKLSDNTKFISQPDQILRTNDLVSMGAMNYIIKEVSNWHRSTMIKFIGTMYTMVHQGNLTLSESQVTLFANSLLSHAFGFLCGPDKNLYSPVPVATELEDIRPDAVMGFFGVKTTEEGQASVVSMLPNLDGLAICLEFLVDLGFYLGTNEVLLPVCVAEFKATDNLTDLTKLAYEMDRLRQIHEMVWKEPPKTYYGIYIDGFTWYIRALSVEDSKPTGTVWTKTINSLEDAVYVGAVLYRFSAYLLDSLTKLTPDYKKLKNLIFKLAKDTQMILPEQIDEIEAVLDQIEELDSNDEPSTTDSDNSSSSVPTDDLHIQKFFDSLVAGGFSDIRLLKEHGEATIFECRKGTGLGAIKIGPWRRIENEAIVLKQLRGPGVEWLYMSGQIENSDLGYLILERLYPLPTRIDSAKELQRITSDIMISLARIHKMNYLHRDIKPSNMMMDKTKTVKLIDFECAMKEDAEKFNVFFGTDFYKPPELSERYCFRCIDMRRAKVYGSFKADSYSAALVCASLMYDVTLDSKEDIQSMLNWLEAGKLACRDAYCS